MEGRDVVVVGASAGGVAVVRALVAALPADLPAAVAVVVHVSPAGSDVLASILDRSGPMRARVALDGERLERSTVLLAPPDRHLLLGSSACGPVVALSAPGHGPGGEVGGAGAPHRPGVDALLLSAARALGPRVVAVVLSGDGEDGAAGTAAVLAAGGAAVVQEPDDAPHPSMPRAALAAAGPAAVTLAPADGLAAAVTALVLERSGPASSWARAS